MASLFCVGPSCREKKGCRSLSVAACFSRDSPHLAMNTRVSSSAFVVMAPLFGVALLVVALFATGCSTAPAVATPRIVYFAQITDTHHGPGLHQWRFDRAIDGINAAPFPLACVFHTGDFASNNLHRREVAESISNQLSRLSPPVLAVPGNHDTTKRNAPEAVQMFERSIGPLATAFETNGVVFIAVYTEPLRSDLPDLGLDYDPIAWLRKTLRETHGKPVIVATHVPPFEDFYAGTVQPGWPESSRRAWEEVLGEGNVVAVVCGHFHRDEVHWDRRGVPTYVAAPIASFWGRQASYRIYELDTLTGRLSYRTFYIEDPKN